VFLVTEVKETDVHGDDLRDGEIRAVTTFVSPLLVRWVGGGSVKFDAKGVILVEVIQVAAATLGPDAGLAPCGGQAVRALHPADVSQLEQRKRALARFAKSESYVPAPPELRPGIQRFANPIGGSALAAYGATDPLVGVFEGSRCLDQVEDCVLDSGARR